MRQVQTAALLTPSEAARERVVMGYQDGRAVLEASQFTARPAQADDLVARCGPPGLETRSALRAAFYQQLLFAEGTTHERLRKVLDGPLVGAAARLEPFIRETVRRLIRAAQRSGEIDLEKAFALPLAVRALAHLLGWPKGQLDVAQMVKWSSSLINLTTGYEVGQSLSVVHQEMTPAFRKLVAAKREGSTDDLTSLIAAHPDLVDETERVMLLMVVFTAGTATVVTALVNGLPLLLADPERLAALRTELGIGRASLTRLVEELVRMVTPTQFVRRWSTEEVTLNGGRLDSGCPMQVQLAGMNRDPLWFPNPEVLDWHRPRVPVQAAYGFGPHTCPGAPLARMELRVALEALLQLPLQLIEQPEEYNANLNQLRRKHVRLRVASPERREADVAAC